MDGERRFVIRELLRTPQTPTSGEGLYVYFNPAGNDRDRQSMYFSGDKRDLDNLLAILKEYAAFSADPAELARLRKDAEAYRKLQGVAAANGYEVPAQSAPWYQRAEKGEK